MKRALLPLLVAMPVSAHRLDQYLQATQLAIDADRIHASLRLVPGVSVASAVIATLDTNSDGVILPFEQRAYAERVRDDLLLDVDGVTTSLRVVSVEMSSIGDLGRGVGELHVELEAEVPRRVGPRTLALENHHQPVRSVYLMNTLVPADRRVRIVRQARDPQQTWYRVDYAIAP